MCWFVTLGETWVDHMKKSKKWVYSYGYTYCLEKGYYNNW